MTLGAENCMQNCSANRYQNCLQKVYSIATGPPFSPSVSPGLPQQLPLVVRLVVLCPVASDGRRQHVLRDAKRVDQQAPARRQLRAQGARSVARRPPGLQRQQALG